MQIALKGYPAHFYIYVDFLFFLFLIDFDPPTSLEMMVRGVASNPQSMGSVAHVATQFIKYSVIFWRIPPLIMAITLGMH